MPIDHESSRRITLLRFPAIVGILYIHAFNSTISFAGATVGRADIDTVTDFVRILISQCLARIAVPLFFLMAGYLFFANFRWSPLAYLDKLRSRTRSLLLPFLFWNLLVLALNLAFQLLPGAGPYLPEGASLAATHDPFTVLNAILGLNRYPIAYHMWFIRDLMLLILLAPVIGVLVRVAAAPFFIVLSLCWIRDIWPIPAPGAVGVLFFAAGAYCAGKGKSLFALDRFGPLALIASLPIMLADVIYYASPISLPLHRSGLIVEVIATLYATKLIVRHESLSRHLTSLAEASFFVFAAHEPLLGIIRTVAYQYLPLGGSYTMLALYLTIPLLVTVTLTLSHRTLNSLCPKALGLITGGR